MNPVDFSELKKFPWNEEIYLAQQGDTGAMLKTCNSAEPIVNQFCKVFYFSDWLGKGEVRSIASLALVEFIMSYPGGVPDEEIPALIKQAIKCDLINSVHRAEFRRSKEEAFLPPDTGSPDVSSPDTGSPDEDAGDMTELPDPPGGEPEASLLQKEYAQKVQDALQRLSRNEQNLIQSYYFRGESSEETAAALGCTRQFVHKVRSRALRRLREILDRQAVC